MTPTDKELIRLAAKAFFGSEDEATHTIVSLGWNPLTSNEDAFMVAAWLGISMQTSGRTAVAICMSRVQPQSKNYVSTMTAGSSSGIYGALRRAVTEVAATIGRDMP